MIERIHIEQLAVSAHIGATAEERQNPQTLSFNITLWPGSGGPTDKLEDTIDYAVVAKTVAAVVMSAQHTLIETLAEKIASELIEHFAAERVAVEVRKFVLPDVEYVSVTALRE